MNKALAILLLCFGYLNSWATVQHDTLYINRQINTVATYSVHYCSFNNTDTFQVKNHDLTKPINDTIDLVVINNDSLSHTFTIDNYITSGNTIAAGDTGRFEITINTEGTYRYYSDVPYGQMLGASGILQVGYDSQIPFFWNLFDYQSVEGEQIALGNATGYTIPYLPEVYSFNNLPYPDILNDSTCYLNASVNDNIVISIVNSGNMNHILHFHGYHVTILQAHISDQVGWSKDTFPVLKGEAMTIQLVPDQPGIYPVHSHNLAALNTGGYPGGMLTLLNITP